MGKVKSNRKSNRSEKSKEKTVTKTNGFIGIGQDSNLIQVDIKDGKMVRIRPFYYETTAEIKPWKLVISNHGRWRVHANHDDMIWLREIETCKIRGPDGYQYQPVWINPAGAAKREIKHGDIVKIYNERGAVLAGAYITERMMPGSISIDHGARYDALVPGELDRGGAINTITPHKLTSKNATGMAVGGFLADVERADIDELRRKYPEVFRKPYDPAAGLCFERVLAEWGSFSDCVGKRKQTINRV